MACTILADKADLTASLLEKNLHVQGQRLGDPIASLAPVGALAV